MDALTMLEKDHAKVKDLLTQLEATTERGVKIRSELFATIKGELTLHETIEEEIFYPALKSHQRPRTSCSRVTRSTTSSTCSWASSRGWTSPTNHGARRLS